VPLKNGALGCRPSGRPQGHPCFEGLDTCRSLKVRCFCRCA